MDYDSFQQNNDRFTAHGKRSELKRLPPGSYRVFQLNDGTIMFEKFDPNYDGLIDLPSAEYEEVMREVNDFLSPEALKTFKELDYLYKRSFLFHGIHGTGKTCLVNRVGEKVIEKGGVILFNPDPRLIVPAFRILEDIQPDVVTMVQFEEFEAILKRHEDTLLSLLDGEIQKRNVIYIATTNHIEKIPARLQRPGRFPTILEIKFPKIEARRFYLQIKLKGESADVIEHWARETEGLSIDELKETVLAVKCLKKSLPETVKRILASKERISASDAQTELDGDSEEKVMFTVRHAHVER